MATSWGELARRAAASVKPGQGKTTECVSVSFAGVDGSRGAVHLEVAGGISAAAGVAYADALHSICAADQRHMRVVSVTRHSCAPLDIGMSNASHGVRLGIDVQEGDGGARRLHIARSIAAAQKLSEESVLDVGGQLRSIFELARDHAHSLDGLVAQYSPAATAGNENISSTIDSLGTGVEHLNRELVDRVTKQAKALDKARLWTSDIVRLGQSIAQIAASARMLTFNARIESARLGEAGRGFAVIAQSVQDLATQIREANDSVGELASNLAHSLPELGTEAQAMATDARSQLAGLIEQLARVRTQLDATREQAHDSLLSSTQNAEQLKSRANHVLEKLQFQDRTNQMLEEARGQAEALLRLVGVDESNVSQAIVEQVGWLGKQLEGAVQLKEAGSVELF